MKKTFAVIVSGIFIGAIALGIVIAEPKKKHSRMGAGHDGGFWKDGEIVKTLGLSKEQVQKLNDLHISIRKDEIRTHADINIKELELAEAFDAEKTDEGKVKSLAKEIADLREKVFLSEVSLKLGVKKILSSEQMEKLKDLICQRRNMKCRSIECDDDAAYGTSCLK